MSYFTDYAQTLIKNGYFPLPVKVDKSITIKNWQNLRLDDFSKVETLISKEQLATHRGVGILCNKTGVIGIDIDVYDSAIADIMVQYMRDTFGDGGLLFRYGGYPKVLIPMQYRGDKNSKRMSASFTTDGGKVNRIEIIRGGQFVAFNDYDNEHGHYVWQRFKDGNIITNEKASILDVPVNELPIIDEDGITKLLNYYEKLCASRGLSDKNKPLLHREDDDFDDDILGNEKPKVSMSIQEVKEMLNGLVQFDPKYVRDYEQWIRVGMALYHQYDGEKQGYDLWIKWSRNGEDTFNEAEAENGTYWNHWKSFDPSVNNDVVTLRSLIHEHRKLRRTEMHNVVDGFIGNIKAADTFPEVLEAMNTISRSHIPLVMHEMMIPHIKARLKEIDCDMATSAIRRELMRSAVAHGVPNPDWCKPWVFVDSRSTFFNLQTMENLDVFAFDMKFTKQANQDSDKVTKPHKIFSEVYDMPTVSDIRYNPTQGEIFSLDNRRYANYYRRDTLPELPEELTDEQQWAVEVFRKHIMEHLVDNAKDARTFVDWLAYITQNTGEMVGWACVLQGVEGDGKSTIAHIMQHVLGKPNVRVIGNEVVQGAFKSWVGDNVLCVIEEIDISGKEKYQVLNNMKQYITNPEVDLHQKGRDAVSIQNFSNYLFLTNNPFALPINEKDRRYFFMRSRFQTRQALQEFKTENPSYYADLVHVRNNPALFAGAIRKFLLEWDISAGFNAQHEAPMNEVKQEIIMESAGSDEMAILRNVLSEHRELGMNRELFDLTSFIREYVDDEDAVRLRRQWVRFFNEIGMRRISGHVRVDHKKHIMYSENPKNWTKDGKASGLIDQDLVKSKVEFKTEDDLWFEQQLEDL